MTLFRSDFSYFASKIILIIRVELIVPSDSKHLSTYTLIKDSSGLTLLSVNGINSYVLTSNIGDELSLNGSSPPKMTFLENLRSNPIAPSKSLPMIISYLLLVDLAT